ncbi:MAG TPA: hypothetical protein DDZ55_04265, partial [Firmicutes bacterium]|nr:hypothetical protein [Bacillota bacterium]
WPEYTVNYRYGQTTYEIKVENPNRKQSGGSYLELDGEELEKVADGVPLVNDGRRHHIRFVL